MPKSHKNTLSGLTVSQAMRRQMIRLDQATPIANSINTLIKYKINALLTTDQDGEPVGVLSKTDVMGAYYAGLPIDSPLADIMSRPPLFCRPEDPLEEALGLMRTHGIYRLFARDARNQVVGVLAYPDIVGLLYQYCRDCDFSQARQKRNSGTAAIRRFAVGEIMTRDVKAVAAEDSLLQVMETLSAYRFGAILVRDRAGAPCGVISKTDLALAYKRGVDAGVAAGSIMSSPVQTCGADDLLEDAIRKMIFSDVHRLFVHQTRPQNVVGVFSLSDAARIRSGSCQACTSSRIHPET